jgi:hypothetical protein
VLKNSLVTDEPKLAKVKPLSVGSNPESAGVAATATELSGLLLQPAAATTMRTDAMIRRVLVNVLFMTFFVS